MANEKKLDCVILGLLCHESLTGYEIKKRMDKGLKYFWGASFGSIYPTLSGLVDRGLATVRKNRNDKRNKQFYTITEKGHDYLRLWLKAPVEKDELRYETLLKLFFGNDIGKNQTISHIKAFREKIETELMNLKSMEKVLESSQNEDNTHIYYLLTVQFGINTYSGYLEWCDYAVGILENKIREED